MNALFKTQPQGWVAFLRVVLGLIMFPHGAQKLLGWFGGYGLPATVQYFEQSVHLPTPLAYLIVFIEFFGSLGLIFGFLTRLSALGIGAIMIGAIATQHWHVGFFMNWGGNLKGEGFEYGLLILAVAAMLTAMGAGAWSIDRLIATKRQAAAA